MDLAGARARFERSLGGEIVRELVRVEVIERSLALASKLFVAVIPLSIILRAVTPGGENFGDDLVMRLGLSGWARRRPAPCSRRAAKCARR